MQSEALCKYNDFKNFVNLLFVYKVIACHGLRKINVNETIN